MSLFLAGEIMILLKMFNPVLISENILIKWYLFEFVDKYKSGNKIFKKDLLYCLRGFVVYNIFFYL